jgi:hypothetical protein
MASVDQGKLRILYCNIIGEIGGRLELVDATLEGKFKLPKVPAQEFCYLQLRMICELIALGCLAAHGEISDTHRKPFQTAYQADLIMTLLENLHSDFYPVPVEQVDTDGVITSIKVLNFDHLSKDQLQKLYIECGKHLHRGTMKSMAAKLTTDEQWSAIREWHKKIVLLLFEHQISLVNPNQILWVRMADLPDGKIRAGLMHRADHPPHNPPPNRRRK